MIVMKTKLVKIAWAGSTKAEWKANLKRLQCLKLLMIAIKRMSLKRYRKHCLEISKFKDRVKLMTKLKNKIDNLSITDRA